MVGEEDCWTSGETDPVATRAPGSATTFRFKEPETDESATETAPETHLLILYERQDENRIEVPETCRSPTLWSSRRNGC